MAGVNGKGFGLWGGSGGLALVPCFAAKTVESVEHKGRHDLHTFWQLQLTPMLVANSVFVVLARPPKF